MAIRRAAFANLYTPNWEYETAGSDHLGGQFEVPLQYWYCRWLGWACCSIYLMLHGSSAVSSAIWRPDLGPSNTAWEQLRCLEALRLGPSLDSRLQAADSQAIAARILNTKPIEHMHSSLKGEQHALRQATLPDQPDLAKPQSQLRSSQLQASTASPIASPPSDCNHTRLLTYDTSHMHMEPIASHCPALLLALLPLHILATTLLDASWCYCCCCCCPSSASAIASTTHSGQLHLTSVLIMRDMEKLTHLLLCSSSPAFAAQQAAATAAVAQLLEKGLHCPIGARSSAHFCAGDVVTWCSLPVITSYICMEQEDRQAAAVATA